MKQSYAQVYITCPFYLGDDGKREIACEGVLPGSVVRLQLASQEHWEAWTAARCMTAWEQCPYHAAAMGKYQEK